MQPKNTTAKKTKAKSTYARRQQRRAEQIIQATGEYPARLRNLVKDVLEHEPSKLPQVFAALDKIDQRSDKFREGLDKFAHRAYSAALKYYSKHHKDPEALAAFSRTLAEVKKYRGKIDAETQAKANKIDMLISDPRSHKDLVAALGGILCELSNRSQISVDEPGIAGTFYAMAASKLRGSSDPLDQTCLRHVDLLLNKPNREAIKALERYWCSIDPLDTQDDPFPAETKDKATSKRRASHA